MARHSPLVAEVYRRGKDRSIWSLFARETDVGHLVLSHGAWERREIVPADWVLESLRPHVATGDGLECGYQWWCGRVDGPRVRIVRALRE